MYVNGKMRPIQIIPEWEGRKQRRMMEGVEFNMKNCN
jgi:hypothetical protein